MNELPLGMVRDPKNPALVSKLRQLDEYDATAIRDIAKSREGWSDENARKAELGAKRFLGLRYLDPDYQHAPYPEADAFWHHMVLNTPWYREFCEAIFGTFLDHVPTPDPDPALMERSHGLYQHWYGDDRKSATETSVHRCSACKVLGLPSELRPAEEAMFPD